MNFLQELSNVTVYRASRDRVTMIALENASSIETTVLHAINPISPLHKNASMILELIAIHNIRLVLPFIDSITGSLKHLTDETAIRCFAKICSLLSIYEQEIAPVRQIMTEVCFDWLIGDYKVAPKAYALYILANFADSDDWIAEELQVIIENQYPESQPAFKAAARKVIQQLKKQLQPSF